MDSKNEIVDSLQIPEEGQLYPRIEKIDGEFIKKEENDDNFFVVQGIVESSKAKKDSIKDEILENNGSENFSSSIV